MEISKWWDNDVADASQIMFNDPATALESATLPSAYLQGQELADPEKVKLAEDVARMGKGNFLDRMKATVGFLNDGVDKRLSEIPGYGVAKNVAGAILWPVDKLASGLYWTYSNVVSQPLSTGILQAGKANIEGDASQLFDWNEWSDAYSKAEHISPGQALANYALTDTARGEIPFTNIELPAAEGIREINPDVSRQAERYLYDTEYWRNKAGWTYTAGTGASDFAISVGIAPEVGIIKGAAMGVRAAKNIEIAGQAGRTISAAKKTPVEATRTKSMQDLYKWMEGKTGQEIAQSPVFGKGRRKDQFADAYGEVYSKAPASIKPLITRFQTGDPLAVKELASRNADIAVQLGRMNDNRAFLDSVRFDEDLLGHFMAEEDALRVAPHLTGRAGAGAVPSNPYLNNQLVEPPYPRPITPGPAQDGWDKTYGHIAQQAEAYRAAASEALKTSGISKMFGGTVVRPTDMLAANRWKAGRLDSINAQLDALRAEQGGYAQLFDGQLGKPIDELAPGQMNMFGSTKTLYRVGPLTTSTSKQADKAVARRASGRGSVASGVTSRVIRNGFYRTPYRVFQSFGEKMPLGFVDHNADDAASRVMDWLKQVKGLDPADRMAMASEYARQGDKVGRGRALEALQGAVVHHYAKSKGLDPAVANELNVMVANGLRNEMMKISGAHPSTQKFTSAPGVGWVDSGEGMIMAPHASTQLSMSDALMDVREFERFINRHSGMFQNIKQGNIGSARVMLGGVADSASKIWKASTLLRPGYTLRSVSEEMALSAIKFGMMSRLGNLGDGGWNFMRNRGSEVSAWVGKGSYVPTTGKGAASNLARVSIDDPNIKAVAQKYGLQETKIKVNQAWPLVQSRITHERELITKLDKEITELNKKGFDTSKQLAAKAEAQNILDQHVDYATEILRTAKDATGRRLGEGSFSYRGVEVGEAFSKEWNNPITRDQISSDRAVDFIFAQGESIDTSRLIKTGSWDDVTPDMPHHMESWLHAVNNQMRQDDLYRLVMGDSTLKEARKWLRTPEGKHHLSMLGPWAKDVDGLLQTLKVTADNYLPPGTGLQGKIARNEEITEVDLRASMAREDFPTVHGEEVKATTALNARDTAWNMVDNLIADGYRFLGSIPSDLLVRHPVFNEAYKLRVKSAIDQHIEYRRSVGGDESFTADEVNKLRESAAKQAKNDIRTVVYDPQRTTATEALRFVFPFLSAHSDSLQRWAGMIGEKPEFVGNLAKIYNAPVAANLVTDDQGNHVGQDGYATVDLSYVDPATGKRIEKSERKFVPIEDRVLNLRLPWDTKGQNRWAQKNIPGYGTPIKIQAINTILPGDPWFNPGTGPLVQVPASVIAKQSPSMGDFLQWSKVLPYGPSGNSNELFIPKYMRDAYNAFTTDDPSNEKYQQAYLDVYNRKVAEYHDGGDPVDLKDVESEAKDFMFLQALTAWGSPAQTKASPLTGSPYQFYVDQYKKLREADPKNADAIFQATYGQDYAHFSASLSKSIGVAPTIAAMTTAEEYKDLITQDPQMASWIVGDTYNGGGFSASVYRKQMETEMGGKPLREKQTALDAIRESQVQQGWAGYLKYKGQVDAVLLQSGFRSYQDPGAEAFLNIRNTILAKFETDYPEWAKERGQMDTLKIPNRIKFFEKAIQDPRLQSDPMRFDLAGLDNYLKGRKVFKTMLAERGSSRLSYDSEGIPIGENQDLGYAWRQFQTSTVASNTQFGDVFNRYLENDNLE